MDYSWHNFVKVEVDDTPIFSSEEAKVAGDYYFNSNYTPDNDSDSYIEFSPQSDNRATSTEDRNQTFKPMSRNQLK